MLCLTVSDCVCVRMCGWLSVTPRVCGSCVCGVVCVCVDHVVVCGLLRGRVVGYVDGHVWCVVVCVVWLVGWL